ncbi:sodium:solute symporter [Humisphaera borealis]|uniref:Sodium/solute symporter n=1 Tax=Humisphaera borealis TaxID=2807512 RepID=A0A7M2X0T9_9BACT|nr:sodium:solute symporter [Humisphaera borealis]QOV91358.1 sodium/solute symporter [Humisphaera borealis]
MTWIDLIIIAGYLGGICMLGVMFTRRQKTTRHYFTGDRSIPAWAVAASIVATETSTVTFISVPGIAFARGGNFTFLQLAMGYIVGRIVITFLFIPRYFRGELQTVYQLLQTRFGTPARMVSASLFVVMRNIADGIRMLLTAIVLAAVYVAFVPGHDTDGGREIATVVALLLLGAVMILFTYFGGIEAVVWVEVLQLGIYLAGAIAAMWVLAANVSGGLPGAIDLGDRFAKLTVFDFSFDLAKTYTFWSGVVGGCFLTMSTHGTDQYMVQRYLCTDRPSRAGAALLASGLIVFVQFVLFLLIGVLLFAFYRPFEQAGYATSAVTTFPFASPDRVFPDFITKHLPTGLSGLVVAAIFAAALSSSLSAIAGTVVNDLYKPLKPARTDGHYLTVGKVLILVFGVIQTAVALAAIRSASSALSNVLTVAGLVNGPVLGLFLVGAMSKRIPQSAAIAGMAVSAVAMVGLWWFGGKWVAWTWYPLIGSAIVIIVAFIAMPVFSPLGRDDRRGSDSALG